ncbi:GH92 family glycosyl hydrolase [Marinilabilia salmonicolor]|uniref:GH92 family glycosyl hydrolase n=1 Tax=Marinilabilia salmonicolor TaxID=989 RepID=UPI00029AF20D|nr:GH92 family glycosyl hydrolase [Marinilabilia salmonicolor]
MKKSLFLISIPLMLLLFILSCQPRQREAETRLTDYVNPFMGTDGPGNTYPGATVPFGMVQLSPDIGYSGWDRIAGYFYPDSIITGFSHLHLTGTGAGDLYDILLTPVNSRAVKTTSENGNRPYSTFSHDNEHAEPGYYQVFLQDYGINAELTSTQRTGIHNYTFPKDEHSGFLLDLGYSLNWDRPVMTSIEVEDNQTISGYRMSSGWAADQRVWFVAKFSKPIENTTLFLDGEEVEGREVKGTHTKIDLRFSTKEQEEVMVKVGISSAGREGALAAIESEAPQWDFASYRKQASDIWENELSKIKVESDNEVWKKTFYTTLYQSMLAPTLYSDVNGYYKGADGEIHQAEGYQKYDTFSLWDTFRAAHPLYTIMHPDRVPDMVQSLLSHYRETGLLPVWSMQGNETNMMIGYHAVPVIVDAWFKGIGGFDPEEAFEACKSNAMSDDHGIKEYRELGYVPLSDDHENWSVSKTLEYAYDDWCIAMFAKDLGKTEDYEYYLERASNWKNHFDPETGFMRPRHADGRFISHFDPKEYTDHFCESNGWHYFWFVPHDIEGLRDKLGSERFSHRLDSMFTYEPEASDDLPIFSTGMIGQYAHGNEPSHHVAYLYNYTGESWKTQERVRQILTEMYQPEPAGHCGNEDCGQMSAWYVLSSMGVYPVNPADGIYHIGSPLWRKATISLPGDKNFTISAPGVSETAKYVASVTLNGEKLSNPWIHHSDIVAGGTLVLEMTDEPNTN